MEKLSTFRSNDSAKLLHLAKELEKTNFFETFLNENEIRILKSVLNENDSDLWKNFIEGNCVLRINKDENRMSMDSAQKDDEDMIEEGRKPVKLLASHVRYLLWEKAVDYYFTSANLDHSIYSIEEVSNDYSIVNSLDNAVAEEKTNSDDMDGVETQPKQPVREEDDDYDDDEEDEEEEDNSADNEAKTDSTQTEQNIESKDDKSCPVKFSKNDNQEVVIEIPISFFRKETNEQDNSVLNEASTSESGKVDMQENLIKEFNKVYHNFEYDRETLIKRRRLEKSDMQLENSSNRTTDGNLNGDTTSEPQDINNSAMSINFGAGTHSLQHLMSNIQQKRDEIPLNDYELRTLFLDVRKNRGKWANDERVGQEELYDACEKVVLDLRGYTEHSTPFLNKVSKREAPNYSLIIKRPMDLNTVMKKLKGLQYNSKKEFVDDIMLIWSNCLTYNADPKHFLRAHAIAMQKRSLKLIPTIPDITIRSKAEVDKEEELENDDKSDSQGTGKTSKKGRKRTKDENVVVKDEEQVDSSEDKSASQTPAVANSKNTASNVEEPKPSDTTEASHDYEEEEADTEVRDENDGDQEEEDDGLDIQAWKVLTAKSRANYCAQRAALFDENNKLRSDAEAIVRKSAAMTNFNHYLMNSEVVSKTSNLLENDEPYLLEYDIAGGVPGLAYEGVDREEEERLEQRLVDIYLQQANGDPSRIKSPFALPTNRGLNKAYFENISEMQEIRRICFKISLIRQMQTQSFVHHTQMKPPEIEELKEIDIKAASNLPNHDFYTKEIQYSVLRKNIAKIVMQTGFETTEPVAINTLTQVAEKYLSNLIKSLKLHTESNSRNKLTSREILLLTLLENGIEKPDDLHTFVTERILKQQEKLKDLRSKLSAFLKELLRPGLENFNERSFEDNSEQFITGDFSSDLGDDFFGFKELGLDKEYNMLSSSIPIYLLHSRLHNRFSSSVGSSKNNKYEDLHEYPTKNLHAYDIENQIGILRPFYSKHFEKSKAHYIKTQKKKGESTELPENNALLLIEDDELPQKQRNIRPRLPPTGKISSVKKKPLSSAFVLPESSDISVQ
ncbi:Piso0_000975 [Millerozyma farinosa CBS 7064]|uniref:SAGA complex subunit Spt7 n=1 Tax=Pichia sorbitophila (strain ATCC MYA-4447 / BCRC 22081 / CBS 7064 / NBRC 10061 / NRRL Y-12695) TaxID=559304 RepID=G8YQK5_PICSO|nr:Piso0_000975 [Millerozyma farinosa CBS 7064]CCE78940.1 Piso0_000975 [Millerozyma farinosa CBS 7064]